MMGCGLCSNSGGEEGDQVKVLVFGVTGMVGRAVAQSCAISPWMKVHGFARTPPTKSTSDPDAPDPNIKGVTIITGNMLDYQSVLAATKGMDTLFLSTFFWETMNSATEYQQGKNVIDAAVENCVKHVIYNTMDYIPQTADKDDHSAFFHAKAKVANYLIYTGLPYTIVRMGWFYENFLGVFRPHPVSEKAFAIALPMEGVALNMGSLKDFSKCVHNMAIRPHVYVNKTYSLAACYLSIKEVATILEFNLPEFTFFDPGITLRQFKKFDFQGAKDLATMFRHYQTQMKWDTKVLNDFCYSVSTFEDWVANSKQEITFVLEEQILENSVFISDLKAKRNLSLAYVSEGVLKKAQDKLKKVSSYAKPAKILHTLGYRKDTSL